MQPEFERPDRFPPKRAFNDLVHWGEVAARVEHYANLRIGRDRLYELAVESDNPVALLREYAEVTDQLDRLLIEFRAFRRAVVGAEAILQRFVHPVCSP